MKTTVGNILINELLPEDLRDYSREINGKQLKQLMDRVGREHPDKYAEIVQSLKQLGDSNAYELDTSFSLKDFKPIDLDHIYKKFEPGIKKAYDVKSQTDKENKLREIHIDMEKDINNEVTKNLKNPNRFEQWVVSGSKGNPTNLRQIRYAVGNQVNVKNQLMSHFVKGNLANGLSPMNYLVACAGARKGVVGSFISVQKPGAFAKELLNLTNDLVISSHDCHTQKGESYPIDSMDIHDRMLCHDTGRYKRNTVITSSVQDHMKRDGITQVVVRTPLHCEAVHGLCAMCVGIIEDGSTPPIGDTIGIRYAESIAEPLTQMSLSSKHTGGVLQKRTAFEDIEQLMHMPKNFPNAATISNYSGKIDGIENAADGGKHVIINNAKHYVHPAHGIKFKVGDSIQRGDILSDGLPNPAKIGELKGMHEGRKYMVNKLREIYAANGIDDIHPKVLETVVRGAMNLGKVVDPGDHLDFNTGDIVRWNQHQHLTAEDHKLLPVDENIIGFRSSEDIKRGRVDIKKGDVITPDHAHSLRNHAFKEVRVHKNPLKVEPHFMGIERAALHKDDWMSNMAYRFVKGQLINNMAQMKSTNLHSYDPIPSYVSGNFSMQGDGRF